MTHSTGRTNIAFGGNFISNLVTLVQIRIWILTQKKAEHLIA
jgi:hypothetical protein